MSTHIGNSIRTRRSEESKRLGEIIAASSRSSRRDSWLSKARIHGLERIIMRGDAYYMCENPEESLVDRIRRGFAEQPDQEFYIVNDPAREDESTYFLVSGDDALKILALGFLP